MSKPAAALSRILSQCCTLEAADSLLQHRQPKFTQAARWGVWDGFTGRPWTTAGLGTEPIDPGILADYDQAYQMGRDAARVAAWRK